MTFWGRVIRGNIFRADLSSVFEMNGLISKQMTFSDFYESTLNQFVELVGKKNVVVFDNSPENVITFYNAHEIDTKLYISDSGKILCRESIRHQTKPTLYYHLPFNKKDIFVQPDILEQSAVIKRYFVYLIQLKECSEFIKENQEVIGFSTTSNCLEYTKTDPSLLKTMVYGLLFTDPEHVGSTEQQTADVMNLVNLSTKK